MVNSTLLDWFEYLYVCWDFSVLNIFNVLSEKCLLINMLIVFSYMISSKVNSGNGSLLLMLWPICFAIVQLCSEKLATMKHEFEALNRKISNLSKSFNNYFKMKGEPSCSEIIAQLNVYLKKKTSCKIIRDDLQVLFSYSDLVKYKYAI